MAGGNLRDDRPERALSGLSPASAFRKPKLDDMTKELAGCVRWMSHRFEYFHNSAHTNPFQLLSRQGMSRRL